MKLSHLLSTSEISEGRCHCDTLAGLLPYTSMAKVLAEGCLLVGSLCLSCCILVEATDESCVFVG
jgi:hypothetical protein